MKQLFFCLEETGSTAICHQFWNNVNKKERKMRPSHCVVVTGNLATQNLLFTLTCYCCLCKTMYCAYTYTSRKMSNRKTPKSILAIMVSSKGLVLFYTDQLQTAQYTHSCMLLWWCEILYLNLYGVFSHLRGLMQGFGNKNGDCSIKLSTSYITCNVISYGRFDNGCWCL